MRFRMIVKHKAGGDPWNEDEDQPEIKTMEEARKWAKETIFRFNAGLKLNEKPRELVVVEHLGDGAFKHAWRKTNLVTIVPEGGGNYDTARCANCLITGKRYGLGDVRRDPEFKAPGYANCQQAKVLLERRTARRKKAQR